MRLLIEEINLKSCDRLVCAYLVGYRVPLDIFLREDGLARGNLHPSRFRGDIGCVAGWDTALEGVQVRQHSAQHRYPDGWEKPDGKPKICTHPVTWATALPPSFRQQDQGGGEAESADQPAQGEREQEQEQPGLPAATHLGCVGPKSALLGGVYVPVGLKAPVSLGGDSFAARVKTFPSWSSSTGSDSENGDDYVHVPNPQALLPPEMSGGLSYQPEASGRLHTSDVGLFYFNVRANAELQVATWLRRQAAAGGGGGAAQ